MQARTQLPGMLMERRTTLSRSHYDPPAEWLDYRPGQEIPRILTRVALNNWMVPPCLSQGYGWASKLVPPIAHRSVFPAELNSSPANWHCSLAPYKERAY